MPFDSEYSSFMRYKAWADKRLYDSLAALPASALTAPQPIAFGSILRTLHHVFAMDQVWQAHLEGRPHGFTTRDPETCPAFETLAPAQAEIDAWYVAYGAALSPEAAREVLDIAFIGAPIADDEVRMSRGEILFHVVNHTTYHRGHIAEMIYDVPASPPGSDFPIFLRETAG